MFLVASSIGTFKKLFGGLGDATSFAKSLDNKLELHHLAVESPGTEVLNIIEHNKLHYSEIELKVKNGEEQLTTGVRCFATKSFPVGYLGVNDEGFCVTAAFETEHEALAALGEYRRKEASATQHSSVIPNPE